jgi:RNA polymerase sigma-70 factor (ECF subfamily)
MRSCDNGAEYAGRRDFVSCKAVAIPFIWRVMTPQDITKLIVRTSMKDRAAFDLLYRQTSAKLFGVCLRVLNDRAEAEEALQEVYVKIWTKADRFAVSDLSPISWLVAIARNHSIDRIRARRQAAADIDSALDVADPAPSPEAMAVAGDEKERIHNCLEELEKDRAAAVRGAYLRGESYAELAARFSVPLNTMRTWLRRSLMKLRECLER